MRLRFKKKQAKVNIILSSYNGEAYIKEQIASIIDQTYTDWHLYIFDDGSTDATVAIAEEFAGSYPDKITVRLNEHNMGSTKSFLYGVRYVYENFDTDFSDPENYYMFCDQDDVWLKDKIAVSLKALKRIEHRHAFGTPLAVFTDALIVDQNLKFIKPSFYREDHLKPRHTELNRLLMENKCLGCTMMFNSATAALIRIPEDGIRYHDWWTALIATSFGHVRYVKVPSIMYRQHSDNQVGQTGFSDYVADRTSSKDNIKNRLSMTYAQAEAFRGAYGDIIKERRRKVLDAFIRMQSAGFFKRRLICMKYRFFKSGFLRNIGLMIYL